MSIQALNMNAIEKGETQVSGDGVNDYAAFQPTFNIINENHGHGIMNLTSAGEKSTP